MSEWFYMLRWVLLLIGVTYLITEAGIMMSFRVAFSRAALDANPRAGTFAFTLIYCPSCIGFWVGVALGALHHWPFDHGYWSILESGLAAMAVTTTWSKTTGGNGAWDVEERLIFDDEASEETLAGGEDG